MKTTKTTKTAKTTKTTKTTKTWKEIQEDLIQFDALLEDVEPLDDSQFEKMRQILNSEPLIEF